MNDRDLADYGRMMADSVRMTAYRRAIERVCPGRIVCEIGTGLGPLSLFALRAGARRVYGIEVRGDVLAAAERVIRANGFDATRFVAVPGLSGDVTLPEPADVLLSELLDSTGLGENTTVFLEDACRRLLGPGGVCLPAALECQAALSAPAAWAEEERLFAETLPAEHGLSYHGLVPDLRRHPRSLSIASGELLSAFRPFEQVVFGSGAPDPEPAAIDLIAQRAGRVTGIAIAFDATLAHGIHLRTFPGDPATHWQQGFLPLRVPLAVKRGEWLRVTLRQERTTSPVAPLRARVSRVAERPDVRAPLGPRA